MGQESLLAFGPVSRRGNKYKNKVVQVGDIKFQSQAEARRYQELLLLNKAGVIGCLELQPEYPLVVQGVNVGKYIADFKYIEFGDMADDIIEVVEDVKGVRTAVYRLKKKLVEAIYRIKIQEVMA